MQAGAVPGSATEGFLDKTAYSAKITPLLELPPSISNSAASMATAADQREKLEKADRKTGATRGITGNANRGDGMALFRAWLGDHSRDFELTAEKRDVDGGLLDRALEVVRAFIVERGLVLYGGTAIDRALRLKGAKLYPDEERPDYDAYSPRNVDDARELADRMHAAGLPNVGAIRAIHAQTMKVKTDFQFVADITYAPPQVFERLPVVTYQGMKVVHPDFQRMDMHLAFCFPFSGAPREDIYNRWRKDLKRFNMLDELYPITPERFASNNSAVLAARARSLEQIDRVGAVARTTEPSEAKMSSASEPHVVTIPPALARTFSAPPLPNKSAPEFQAALHGFAAYAALRHALEELAETLDAERPELEAKSALNRLKAPKRLIELEPSGGLRFDGFGSLWGAGPACVLAAPEPEKILSLLEAPEVGENGARTAETRDHRTSVATWFNPYMDLCPAALVGALGAGPLVVFSTANRQLAVTHISLGPGGSHRIRIVSPQYLLLFFLQAAHRGEGAQAATAIEYYLHTLEILQTADFLLASALDAQAPEKAAKIACLLNASPFGLTTRGLGETNFDAAFLIRMASAAQAVGDEPPPPIPNNVKSLLEGLPGGYYPATSERSRKFDYTASPLFQRDGGPRKP